MLDAKTLLQNELLRRCNKNKAYSMRAFAKSLDIPIATLSAVINGKRDLSKKNLLKVKSRLNFGEPDPGLSNLMSENEVWNQLEADTFLAISTWYHFAILELVKIFDGQVSPRLISEKLGLRLTDASAGLNRLERIGLLKRNLQGRYQQKNDFNSYFNGQDTSETHKSLMIQYLEIAKEKIQTVPLEERDHSSMTLRIHSSDLPKAKKLLKKLRRNFTEEMERTRKPDQVYELTLAFYPLTISTQRKNL